MSFTDALRLELKQIEAELEKDPRFRRATRIRELLAEYEGPSRELGGPGKYDSIKQELFKLIKAQGGPVHRKILLDQLIKLGLMGREKDPMASLAHYLSTSGFFVSNNNGSWSLK
jgi:hypothetical protein